MSYSSLCTSCEIRRLLRSRDKDRGGGTKVLRQWNPTIRKVRERWGIRTKALEAIIIGQIVAGQRAAGVGAVIKLMNIR
jgi:hypothetical protein